MLKRNKKNDKNDKKIFVRTHTDINNYNNFLIELDKKNQDKIDLFKDNPKLSIKNNIKNFVKQIDKNFNDSDFKNPNFKLVSF